MSFKFNTTQNVYEIGKSESRRSTRRTTYFPDWLNLLARPKNGFRMQTKAFLMLK